jgi:hypothetical protein
VRPADLARVLDRRPVAVALSVAALAIPILFVFIAPHVLDQRPGVDFELYRDATSRWLSGGSFYEPYQLAGPYDISAGDILYPPVALWLFAPFAAVGTSPLAAVFAVLWWAIPLALTACAILVLQPRPLVWPLLALCASNPTTLLKTWTGNPVLWSMAALAVAVVTSSRFTAPFVLLKPSLAPFAVFGVRRRSWWGGAVVLAVLSLPFVLTGLWGEWLRALANSRGGGLLYSSLEAPMLLLPLVAWLGRRRGG